MNYRLKKYFLLLIFSFISILGFAQKEIDVAKNDFTISNYRNIKKQLKTFQLDDLSKTNDSLNIRIWMGRHIVEINRNKSAVSAKLINFIYAENNNLKPVYETIEIDSAKARKLLDTLLQLKIMNLQGSRFMGIDGQVYHFEVSTSKKYRFYSYWSPSIGGMADRKIAAELLAQASTQLRINTLDSLFVNSLPSGEYRANMWFTINVDHFCENQMHTSTLYNHVKNILDKKFDSIIPSRFPLIFLNGKQINMCNLNKYEFKQVENIKIYTSKESEAAALYGINGGNGVVIIKLK